MSHYPILHIYVNGYGAPEDPVEDGNLTRYLGAVMDFIAAYNGSVLVYLAGGHTNRPELSEAKAMLMWLGRRELPDNISDFILLEQTITARDNLQAFASRVHPTEAVMICCEYSRRWTMRWLAYRHFGWRFRTLAVPFDARSLKWYRRLVQYFWKFPRAVLGR